MDEFVARGNSDLNKKEDSYFTYDCSYVIYFQELGFFIWWQSIFEVS